MKAVVFHDVGDIRLDNVASPGIEAATDAIVRLTTTAICGTDLHLVRGTLPGMKPGTIVGHEGVGVVERVGDDVRNFQPGDRVVIASTIACGYCGYCRDGAFALCDTPHPGGARAGTAFFGGPESAGAVHGLQAERARIPFANVTLVRIPDGVEDDRAVVVSDILPTGYFAAELADVGDGDTVAVFGCGPIGLCAILSARLQGAARILAVDTIAPRLQLARSLGAEVIDFNAGDPVEAVLRLTGGHGADRVIDAVGVDAVGPRRGSNGGDHQEGRAEPEVRPVTSPRRGVHWRPGDAPSQALAWAVRSVVKAGTLAVIGTYPTSLRSFAIGEAMSRNLTVKSGTCHHRRYMPMLLDMLAAGLVDPMHVLTEIQPFHAVIDAYEAFDVRQPGWVKVDLALRGAV
jgi:threonine dehydrogenase-like Zn-dependent dehydrogenase